MKLATRTYTLLMELLCGGNAAKFLVCLFLTCSRPSGEVDLKQSEFTKLILVFRSTY